VTLYWLARLVARPHTAPIRIWEWGVLGVLLGVAALSKLQGLGLLPLAALVGLGLAWQRREWRLLLRAALPVALPVVAIAGWWYWRNFTLYGDWLGVEHLVSINGLRDEPLTWENWQHEFRGLRYSFWGLFGWFNILLPTWIYTLLDGFMVVATAGVLFGLFTSRGQPRQTTAVRWLLVGWATISALLLLYWMNKAMGSQGRLIFPALTAIAILGTAGLEWWVRRLPHLLQACWLGAAPALLAATTLYAGIVLLPQSYQPAAPVKRIPDTAQMLDIQFGIAEPIMLLAVDAPEARVRPGEWVPVTLYWMAQGPLSVDYELFVQLLDEQGETLGNVTTHPGWGRNPTRLWQAGLVYADTYHVQVRKRIAPTAPVLAQIYTGFIEPTTTATGQEPLPAFVQPQYDGDPDNPGCACGGKLQEIRPIVGHVTVLPLHAPALEEYGLLPVDSHFGEAISLAGLAAPTEVAAGATLTVTVLWEAMATPARDYTAFAHLLDEGGNRVAGYDQQPAGNRFPTSAWRSGDRIVSELPLALPADLAPGTYTLAMGLYDSASPQAERLAVTGAAGREVLHNMLLVQTVKVVEP
jgi:hypothetical protein